MVALLVGRRVEPYSNATLLVVVALLIGRRVEPCSDVTLLAVLVAPS